MDKYHIPNLDKACHVLNYISNAHGECQLKHIAAALSIPRTTALRITQTLLKANYLAEDEDRGFTLGTALVQLGVKALDNLDIRGFARPVLHKLSNQIVESSHLAMLTGDRSLLVEVADSPSPIRIASRPGTLVELHCSATGKIFLAYSIPEPRAFCQSLELTTHTPNTDVTVEEVLESIEQTRKQGYAIDEEEYVLGVRCIATPVTNAFGKTIASIGITASTSTFTKKKINAMAKALKAAAEEISTNMGFSQ
ncbi:MAG: IclR family transcriptional regulator [Planctomycetaceae bacterium]|jgi:DNA-binding IclR family transcriptional regulator|nr:IclR family transcriptional regulator [Planctomycetaceae bacterium]